MGTTTCPSVVVFQLRSADSTSGGLGLSSRSERNAKALSCLIVWSVALGGLFAAILALNPAQISPYIKLPLTVSGANSRFTMRNGAALKFPGWFNATGATIDITGSTITGFTDSEIANSGLNTDENNDGPLIAWASTTASL